VDGGVRGRLNVRLADGREAAAAAAGAGGSDRGSDGGDGGSGSGGGRREVVQVHYEQTVRGGGGARVHVHYEPTVGGGGGGGSEGAPVHYERNPGRPPPAPLYEPPPPNQKPPPLPPSRGVIVNKRFTDVESTTSSLALLYEHSTSR